MEQEYLDKLKQIEKQSEYWDLLARYSPIAFFLFCGVSYWFDIVDIKLLIIIGSSVFVITSLFWWAWTLYNIKFLIRSLTRATSIMLEVKQEFRSIHQDLKSINPNHEID